MDYIAYSRTNYLEHHGVLGMKWGVRRYQNEDGSYTKKGLERYHKHMSEYESARTNYKADKTKSNRQKMKSAKRNLNESYDRLKIDKRADKGEKLYSKGHTITINEGRTPKIQATIVLGAMLTNRVLSHYTDQKTALLSSAAVALGASAINWGIWAKKSIENRNMRAYNARLREDRREEKKQKASAQIGD